MKPEEFEFYGATNRALKQFLNDYDKMLGIVQGVRKVSIDSTWKKHYGFYR